jgi:hypothetical protein
MEVIERKMDERGVVHVMLEWLKVRNIKVMEVIERSMLLSITSIALVVNTFNHSNITCTAHASSILLSITSIGDCKEY